MAGIHSIQQRPTTTALHGRSGSQSHGKSAEHKPSELLKGKSSGDRFEPSNRMSMMQDGESTSASTENEVPIGKGHHKAHHGKGHDKTGKPIPPGLAKKNSADLPDGNPWKTALAEKEKTKDTSATPPASEPFSGARDPQETDAPKRDFAASGSGQSALMKQLLEIVTKLLALIKPETAAAAPSGTAAS